MNGERLQPSCGMWGSVSLSPRTQNLAGKGSRRYGCGQRVSHRATVSRQQDRDRLWGCDGIDVFGMSTPVTMFVTLDSGGS